MGGWVGGWGGGRGGTWVQRVQTALEPAFLPLLTYHVMLNVTHVISTTLCASRDMPTVRATSTYQPCEDVRTTSSHQPRKDVRTTSSHQPREDVELKDGDEVVTREVDG